MPTVIGVVLVVIGLVVMALALVWVGVARRAPGTERRGSRELHGVEHHGLLLVPPRAAVLARGALAAGFAVLCAGGAVLVLQAPEAPDPVAIPLALLALLFVAVTRTFARRAGDPAADALVLAPDGLGPIGVHWVAWADVTSASVQWRGSGRASRYLVLELTDGTDRVLSWATSPRPLPELAARLEDLRADPAARAALGG